MGTVPLAEPFTCMTDASFKPDYVPPHLQGQVSDFRRAADGSVSFFDPRRATGAFGPEASRTTIQPDVYDSTFGDKRFNLAEAADNQYGLPGPQKTFSTMAHDWLVRQGRSGLNYGLSSQGRAAGSVGLLSALAGGAAGFMGDEGSAGKGMLYALLAGTAGAGLTAAGQNWNANRERNREQAGVTKQAFADGDLLSLVSQNFHISEPDKRMYLAAASRLRDREKDELSRLLRVAAGATAGALIARYLRGKGLLNTLAGGMIGAFVGRAFSPQPTYNNLGQLSVMNLY
jgi:hypothetical protein